MKTNYNRIVISLILILLAACLFLITIHHYNQQVDMKSGICSFYSAEYMVVNQVKHKRITIFATKKADIERKTIELKDDINIDIVFSQYILENNQPLTGSYNQYNNLLVLEYAAYEYLKKEKKGEVIIDLISTWAPHTSVATSGKSINAKKLNEMLKKEKNKAVEILKRKAECWSQRQKSVDSWDIIKISPAD